MAWKQNSWNWPWQRSLKEQTIAESKGAAGYPVGLVHIFRGGNPEWSGRSYQALAQEGYMRNPIAHRAIRLIGEASAAVPMIAYRGQNEVSDHPILDLMARPNPRQSGPTFFETLYGQLLISGNAYLELLGLEGDAHELHLLRPDRVRVIADEAGWPTLLEYRSGPSRRYVYLGEDGTGLQISLFHPLDDHYGHGPLGAAMQALDLHNAAAQWNKALLDNSARPSGALVYAPKEGGQLTDEQFERLKSELEEQYSGSRQAGRPLLLEGGLDWKSMSFTPRDMDFLEAKNSAARDIALALGVPPMLLGIPGDNTYSNYQEAHRAFYRLTILPLVRKIAKELETLLCPALGPDIRLAYDADQVDGLASEREALWNRVNQASFLTEDEKREAVGYQPLGGAAGPGAARI